MPPRKRKIVRGLAAVLGLLACWSGVQALPTLELVTSDRTMFEHEEIGPGNTATITYTLQFSGLSTVSGAEDVVIGYDVGIAYDPEVVRLTGFMFHPGHYLGDPELGETYQIDPADNFTDVGGPVPEPDPLHSTWDWRDNSNVFNPSPTGQAFIGLNEPMLGVPDAVVEYAFHQGSIRLFEQSFLDFPSLAPLIDLQVTNNPNPGTVPVATLTFQANLSDYGRTRVQLIFGIDYNPFADSELDVKISDPADPKYPERRDSLVEVPGPSPLLLMPLGLVALGWMRRRSRPRAGCLSHVARVR